MAHVTLRLIEGLPSLRERALFTAIIAAFRGGKERVGFRLVHYSVQANHFHLLIEADDRMTLARGMQALAIRLARRINHVLGRHGRVFDHRYHARGVTSGPDAADTLRYVLHNDRHHARKNGARPRRAAIDPFSSALWLAHLHGPATFPPGFRPRSPPLGRTDPRAIQFREPAAHLLEVVRPRTALLRERWTRWNTLAAPS